MLQTSLRNYLTAYKWIKSLTRVENNFKCSLNLPIKPCCNCYNISSLFMTVFSQKMLLCPQHSFSAAIFLSLILALNWSLDLIFRKAIVFLIRLKHLLYSGHCLSISTLLRYLAPSSIATNNIKRMAKPNNRPTCWFLPIFLLIQLLPYLTHFCSQFPRLFC